MNAKENKADWTLVRFVDEIMKPSGRYTKHRIREYRSAARRYDRFRGGEQSAGEVSVRLIEKLQEALVAEGCSINRAREYGVMICTIVRQVDPDLLPNRKFSEYSKAEPGDLLFIVEHEYFNAKSKIASEATEKQYKYAVTRYSTFLGRRSTATSRSCGRSGRGAPRSGWSKSFPQSKISQSR